jgi:TPR repeat protein
MAADSGLSKGHLNAGNMHRDGKGTKQDQKKAVMHYRKGYEIGELSAPTLVFRAGHPLLAY